MARHNPVWLHAVDSLVRIELDTAERFFRFSESHFESERQRLKRKEKNHSESYWNEELDCGTTMGDLLAEEYAEIAEMRRLNRYFGVILVYLAHYSLFREFAANSPCICCVSRLNLGSLCGLWA